jgi:hypothetical protein
LEGGTILTGLAFVVAEGAVEGCEHSELILFEFVLGFGGGSSRLDDLFNRSNRRGNLAHVNTRKIQLAGGVITFSSESAVTRQCKSSSRLEFAAASLRPLPSLTLPFPRMAILAPDSDSICLSVFPRGPIRRPTVKLRLVSSTLKQECGCLRG